MAIPSSISTFVILLIALLSATTIPFLASGSNVLLSGDVISSEGQLTYNDYSFVMQGDCNLVLYHGIAVFQSNTHGNGDSCSLTLDDRGRLIIRSADGTPRWNSTATPAATKPGKYAAVLRPDGEVVVYGPAVWSTPDFHFKSGVRAENGVDLPPSTSLPDGGVAKNLLFSSQVRYSNATVATRDYSLVMRDDCDLALVKAMIGDVWGTGTMGKGRHCFLRLNHKGRLVVKDDDYRTVWSSKAALAAAAEGEYVLVMQINGQAVIYGPAVWSTVS